nr:DUF3021 family protein [Lachnospiraceae bacterium]
MKKIGEYVKWYVYITTSILMVVALIFGLYGAEELPGETLWQILVSGFVTTLLTVIMVYVDAVTVAGTVMKFIGHYACLCTVMIVLGGWFGWINLNVRGIVLMVCAVAAVYVLAFGAYYIIDLRAAKQMNQRLKEKYGEE